MDHSSLTKLSSLEDFRIKSLPASAFYIANFITEEEEQALLSKIEAAPKPKWKQLSKRRLQTWPSDLIKNALLDSPLPSWLVEPIITRLIAIPLNSDLQGNIFSNSPHGRPNHVLINEYLAGQGIMPHKDGPSYYSVVCTVSLGSSLCLNIHATDQDGAIEAEPRYRIFQEPRSLLITTGEMYTDFLHGIASVEEDIDLSRETIANWELLHSPDTILGRRSERSIRTSLTYRDVIKVSRLGSKFGIFNKR